MMKEAMMAKGYVRPYHAAGIWCLTLICFGTGCAMTLYLLFKLGGLDAYVWALMGAWLGSSVLFLLVMLIFDKTAARYYITPDALYSRNLLQKHCFLADDQVKQIELTMSVGDSARYGYNATAPHLICSDRFFKHDSRISLSYHRKSQIVVRITRKNFPAVQAYLARMGVVTDIFSYDALVQMLECVHEIYRPQDGKWQRYY